MPGGGLVVEHVALLRRRQRKHLRRADADERARRRRERDHLLGRLARRRAWLITATAPAMVSTAPARRATTSKCGATLRWRAREADGGSQSEQRLADDLHRRLRFALTVSAGPCAAPEVLPALVHRAVAPREVDECRADRSASRFAASFLIAFTIVGPCLLALTWRFFVFGPPAAHPISVTHRSRFLAPAPSSPCAALREREHLGGRAGVRVDPDRVERLAGAGLQHRARELHRVLPDLRIGRPALTM